MSWPVITSSPDRGFRIRCEHFGDRAFSKFYHMYSYRPQFSTDQDGILWINIHNQLAEELYNDKK